MKVRGSDPMPTNWTLPEMFTPGRPPKGVGMIKRFFLGAIDVWWVVLFMQDSIKFDHPDYVDDPIFGWGNCLGICIIPVAAFLLVFGVVKVFQLMWFSILTGGC